MPPYVAFTMWLVLLLALLAFDPARARPTSITLWVPVIWIFIVASRLPSQWLGDSGGTAAQAFEEGNPIDRTIFLGLIVLAIVILLLRSFNWGTFFNRNAALLVFLFFALISVIWSDFPMVALRRWIRDLGAYLAILVVLSDPSPWEAVRTVLRRLCYLLIPLSMLLVKYFPAIGKRFNAWTGAGYFVGATTDKNNLGVLCLISGVFFFWDTVTLWSQRKEKAVRRILAVNFVFLAMTLWLLKYADSATSRVCLLIGCLVIVAARSKFFQSHLALSKTAIPVGLCLCLILVFGVGLQGTVAGAVGRDPTLTDRTALWRILLDMHTNPIVGTGYESFWLGSRFAQVSQLFSQVNEAHDGYLEVYLNLGLIGLFLLAAFLFASYRVIFKRFKNGVSIASLCLAIWTVLLVYNITEAAFKFQLMWVSFLLIGIAVPSDSIEQAPVAHPTVVKENRLKPSPSTSNSGMPGMRWRELGRQKRGLKAPEKAK